MLKLLKSIALAAPLLALSACGTEDVAADVEATDTALLEANKQVVLDMWHDVIDGRNIDGARKYIHADYIQHSPGVPNGVEALIEFLHTEFPDTEALEPGSYELTEFEFVLAEGDLVQLMFKRELPSRDDPETLVPVWWYDTYRVQDGMIVEHWDSIHQ